MTEGVATAFGRWRTRALVHAPADVVTPQVPPVVTVEPVDAHNCRLRISAQTPVLLAVYLLGLDQDFEVTDPPELLDALRLLSNRAKRAPRR